jgi:hypothetical protein
MNAAVTHRGAIVRSGDGFGVYWPAPDGAPYFIPIHMGSEGRHRADIGYDEPLLPSHGRLRAGKPEVFEGVLAPLAYVSDVTVQAIASAMRRELRASAFEDRHPVADWSDYTERGVRL